MKDGLLTKQFIEQYQLPVESKTDYAIVERIKNEVFEKAWETFQVGSNDTLQKDFDKFKKAEQEWLPDFALYTILKQCYKGKPWYEWPREYKTREPEALQQFSKAHAGEIEGIRVKQLSRRLLVLQPEFLLHCRHHAVEPLRDRPRGLDR